MWKNDNEKTCGVGLAATSAHEVLLEQFWKSRYGHGLYLAVGHDLPAQINSVVLQINREQPTCGRCAVLIAKAQKPLHFVG